MVEDAARHSSGRPDASETEVGRARPTARQVVRDEGVSGLLRRAVALAYRQGIRPFLPVVGMVRYSGIPVAVERKLGDRVVPRSWRPSAAEDRPEHEAALVAAVRQFVQPGDRVVVVGGGMGVTTTVAALCLAPQGHVDCFEGASECVAQVRRTAELNGVADHVAVRHAVVARSVSVYGTEPFDSAIDPADLPPCDVLELDCEGAEVDILESLTFQPRVILVETHGLYEAPTLLVAEKLRELGYQVEDRGVADPQARDFCIRNDVRVLVGSRSEGEEG